MGVLENVHRYDNAPQMQGTNFDNKTLECSCMAWHACMHGVVNKLGQKVRRSEAEPWLHNILSSNLCK